MFETQEKPRKRHPRRGGYARGDLARERILLVAIEIFAQNGFDRASTRAIAEKAAVNVAALNYYFGGKEALYLACAEHIAERAGRNVETLADMVRSALAKNPGRDESVDALIRILGFAIERIVDSGRSTAWIMFINREQTVPGPAFDILYERIVKRMLGAFGLLVGRILGEEPGSEAVVVRTLALLGPLFLFQRARSVALRALDWPDIDGDRMAFLKDALLRHAAFGLRQAGLPGAA